MRGEHGEQPLTPRNKGSADGNHGCHRHLCGPLTLSSAQLPTDDQANLHKFQLECPPPARLCDPEQTNTSSMSRNDSHLRAVWLLQTLSPGRQGSRHGLKTCAPGCIPQEMLAPPPLATGFSLRGPCYCCSGTSNVSDPSVTPWTVVHQAPLSMEFSRQEYWLPCPPPGIFPTQVWNPSLLHLLYWKRVLYLLSHWGSPEGSLTKHKSGGISEAKKPLDANPGDSSKPGFPPCTREHAVASVMSNSSRPCGLQHAMLPCPWDSPGKNTGVGCHVLLQGIFPIQGPNLGLLRLLHCRRILYC